MLELFRRISVPHLAEHKLRTFATAFGIGLGVATVIGIQLTFQPITAAIKQAVTQISGRSVLKVSNGDAGVPEELLEELRRLPEAKNVSASVQGFVPIAGREGDRLFIFGVDLLEDRQIRDYDFTAAKDSSAPVQSEDPLIFMAKADSVAVTDNLTALLGKRLGDTIDVQSPSGLTPLKIRAVVDGRRGPAAAFSGRIGLMDIYAAQRLLQMKGRFSQIDLSLAPGARIENLESAVKRAVGGRGSVDREQEQLDDLEFSLKLQQDNIEGSANLALLLGIYLVFNTMVIAIAQRWREIGILRALGMRRRIVIALVVLESVALGALGGLIGVPMGVGFARAFTQVLLPLFGGKYAPLTAPPLQIHAQVLFDAIVVGVVTSAIGALVPAVQALAIHPLEAIRRARKTSRRIWPYLFSASIGALLVILSFVVVRSIAGADLRSAEPPLFGAIALCFLGMLCAAPLLIRLALSKAEAISEPVFGGLGSIGGRSLVRSMSRVALTGTAFVASLVMVVLISALVRNVHQVMDEGFSGMLGDSDLAVLSGSTSIFSSLRMPESLLAEIGALDEVKYAYAARGTNIKIESNTLSLMPIPPVDDIRHAFRLIRGDTAKALAAFKRGDGLLLDDMGANRLHMSVGDMISLRSPGGELRLNVAGIVPRASANGGMFISLPIYQRYWRDTTLTAIVIGLKKGASAEAVASLIRRRWGSQYNLFVISPAAFRLAQHGIVDRAVGLLLPIAGIAMVIALFGLMNSLLASIIDRVREIGVLRALGGTARQISRLITIEAMTLGVISGGIAIPLGVAFYYFDLFANESVSYTGMRFHSPGILFCLVILVISAISAAAAGYLPARSAARLKITEAIQAE